MDQLEKIRLPYNVGVLAQTSACFALRHYHMLREQTDALCQQREQLLDQLGQLNSLTVFPSKGNFITFRVAHGRGPEVFESLKARGVLIKNLHGNGVLLDSCLRVTVARAEEMQRFLEALDEALMD